MEESSSIADKLARLAQLEGEFQRTLEAEKLEAMAEFAAGAGHEINNPLTVISGRAQLLLREETDPERKHALALISAQAMRVYEMIADMMLFARPPRPERKPVDLVELVDDLIADLLPRCARQETALVRTGQSEAILIEADPTQLSVALRAICQNAIEALGSGGHIEIAVEQIDSACNSAQTCCCDSAEARRCHPEHSEGSGPRTDEILRCAQDDGGVSQDDKKDNGAVAPLRAVQIRIADDGPGIKPEERRHIFDPYYSARQAGRGLGLGLSKAWRIVTNHGGRIDVESEPGRGTVFSITLAKKP